MKIKMPTQQELIQYVVAAGVLYFASQKNIMQAIFGPALSMVGLDFGNTIFVALFLCHAMTRFVDGAAADHIGFTVTCLVAHAAGLGGFADTVVWCYVLREILGNQSF